MATNFASLYNGFVRGNRGPSPAPRPLGATMGSQIAGMLGGRSPGGVGGIGSRLGGMVPAPKLPAGPMGTIAGRLGVGAGKPNPMAGGIGGIMRRF